MVYNYCKSLYWYSTLNPLPQVFLFTTCLLHQFSFRPGTPGVDAPSVDNVEVNMTRTPRPFKFLVESRNWKCTGIKQCHNTFCFFVTYQSAWVPCYLYFSTWFFHARPDNKATWNPGYSLFKWRLQSLQCLFKLIAWVFRYQRWTVWGVCIRETESAFNIGSTSVPYFMGD